MWYDIHRTKKRRQIKLIRTYRFIKFVIWFMTVCIVLQLGYALINSKSLAAVFEAKMLIADGVVAAVIGYFLHLRKRRRYRRVMVQ